MKYYKITQEDAFALGVTEYRRGNKDGYIVTAGDIAVSEEIAARAVEMSSSEAFEYIINNLNHV